MSTLKVNQVKTKIRALYEASINKSDISEKDKDKDSKILSRCLAALAVQYIGEATPHDAAKSVIDGADDNGIDAIYYNPQEKEVIIVQSKWIHSGTGEPEAKDVSTFIDGIKDLIELSTENFRKEIHSQLDDIMEKINTPGTTIRIVLVTTGASTLARHSTGKLEKFESELNGEYDELATHSIIGLTEIYNFLAEDKTATQKITITLENWHSISQPSNAYYGTVDGLQLKKIWEATRSKIISANIRGALGDTEVNTKIKKTATEEPELFWYYNNGITFTAESVERAAANTTTRTYGTFDLIKPSVVNGAQTISTLSKITDTEALEKVRVAVRIIDLNGASEQFGRAITRSNNLQNRIEGRDFVAQDQEQQRIQKEMYMEGIEYRYIRDSEESITSENSCTLIEATIALACASGDSNLAVAAKTGTGRFFLDLAKAPYKTIFNPQISGSYVFNTVFTLREIEKWIKSEIKTLPKRSGIQYGSLVHGNRIIAAAAMKKLGKSFFERTVEEFKRDKKIESLPEILKDTHTAIINEINKNFQGKFLAVLFKSPTNSKQIFEAAVNP
ncbi:AIPR family protein [Metapseudomonas otitidis]|uniref:AIPR family protein n=1 Tax=Metapseudomonas otitidis TaxID=319939 RepID=UPI001F2A0B54|nr:AIPR family protein [Pseudomonas otitidis]